MMGSFVTGTPWATLQRPGSLIWSENYIYIIFKNLNCKNISRFENFAKIAPCRQVLGRQGTCRPSSWRQGAFCKNPGGAGTCRQLLGRQAPCRQLLGRQAP